MPSIGMTAAAHADITISAWKARVTRTIMPGWNILRLRRTEPAHMRRCPMVVRAVIAALLVATSSDAFGQTGTRASSRKSASIAGRVIHADGAAAESARIAVYAVREGAPAAVVGTAI